MKGKKSKKKKIITICAVVAAVAVGAVLIVPRLVPTRTQAAEVMVQTAVAERGTIEKTVVGSGSFSAGGDTDITIPAMLTVDTVYVEAGDTVGEGDVLARLDAQSVQDAIADTQDAIADIDEQINDIDDDANAAEIEATVAGRVKQIFAQEGDDVRSRVSESGALMVLSLDGKMKVEVAGANDALSAGDDVTVVLSDGTEKSGAVAKSNGDGYTVTLTDNGPELGDAVTILDDEDNQIGSGTLEVNLPLHVVSNEGIVDSVDVELNEKVSDGATLVTLEEDAAELQYAELLEQRQEYEALLKTLMQYAENDTIVSEYAGTISDVAVSAAVDTSQSGDSSTQGNAPMAASAGEAVYSGLVLSGEQTGATLLNVDEAAQDDAAAQADDSTQATVTEITGALDIYINKPVTGNTPQSATVPGNGYTGVIAWQPATQKFEQQTVYTATVTLTASAGYRIAEGTTATVSGAESVGAATISGEAEANTMVFNVTFPVTEAEMQNDNSNILQQLQGMQSSSAQQSSTGGASASGSVSGGSVSGGSTSSASSAATSADTTSDESGLLDSQTMLTMTTGATNTITVSVDELDINLIAPDQQAEIELDALTDEVFTGTVTKISSAGTAQSGVTTYPVTVTLDAPDDRILPGMNANVTITIATSENILLIPLDALQENASGQYVFLSSGEQPATDGAVSEEESADSMSLGEMREVETGLSDGTNVEIVSGLEEGDTVVYVQQASDDSMEAMFSSMFGGGERTQQGGGMMIQSGGGMGGGTPPEGGGGPMGG